VYRLLRSRLSGCVPSFSRHRRNSGHSRAFLDHRVSRAEGAIGRFYRVRLGELRPRDGAIIDPTVAMVNFAENE
jgi:hypothetical protein